MESVIGNLGERQKSELQWGKGSWVGVALKVTALGLIKLCWMEERGKKGAGKTGLCSRCKGASEGFFFCQALSMVSIKENSFQTSTLASLTSGQSITKDI